MSSLNPIHGQPPMHQMTVVPRPEPTCPNKAHEILDATKQCPPPATVQQVTMVGVNRAMPRPPVPNPEVTSLARIISQHGISKLPQEVADEIATALFCVNLDDCKALTTRQERISRFERLAKSTPPTKEALELLVNYTRDIPTKKSVKAGREQLQALEALAVAAPEHMDSQLQKVVSGLTDVNGRDTGKRRAVGIEILLENLHPENVQGFFSLVALLKGISDAGSSSRVVSLMAKRLPLEARIEAHKQLREVAAMLNIDEYASLALCSLLEHLPLGAEVAAYEDVSTLLARYSDPWGESRAALERYRPQS